MQFVSYQVRGMMPLTFDQPLYWKALTSIQSQTVGCDLKHMVLRVRWFQGKLSSLEAFDI